MPEKVAFVVPQSDLPEILLHRGRVKCVSVEDKAVRCEGAYLFYSDASSVILVDRPEPPAIGWLLPRTVVHAIEW
jgi:hypothetical protein